MPTLTDGGLCKESSFSLRDFYRRFLYPQEKREFLPVEAHSEELGFEPLLVHDLIVKRRLHHLEPLNRTMSDRLPEKLPANVALF